MEHVPHYLLVGLQRILIPEHAPQEAQEYISHFAQTWGGLEPQHFLHAIASANNKDCAFAVSAYYTYDPLRAEQDIQKMTTSTNKWCRWSSTLTLGENQHPAVLGNLCTLLLENLTLEHFYDIHDTDNFYFVDWRLELPKHLARYRRLEPIPFVRDALRTCLLIRNEAEAIPIPDDLLPESWHLPLDGLMVDLVFLCGALEVWGALLGIARNEEEYLRWAAIECFASLSDHVPLSYHWKWRDIPDVYKSMHMKLSTYYGMDVWQRQQSCDILESDPFLHDFVQFRTMEPWF